MSHRINISNPDGLTTLYHGTTLENARRIAAGGLHAPLATDIATALSELEALHGVAAGTASREHVAGLRRLKPGEVCLSTGWRHAANYAANGPEYVYLGLCAIGEVRATNGVDWAERHLVHVPAVVTMVAPRAEIAARITVPRFVTDEVLEPGVHPIGAAMGVAHEIILAGPLPAAWVTAIDELGHRCRCDDVRDGDRCPRCPKSVHL